MPNYFIDSSLIAEDTCIISGDNFHHIVNVRRAEIGASLSIVDERGGRYEAVVTDITADRLVCSVTLVGRSERRGPDLCLYLSLLKGKKFDLAVQKAVEVGVSRIVPVMTERSIPDYRGKGGSRNERWNRIAEEAAKQSLRSSVPEVAAIMDFKDAVSQDTAEARLMAHPEDSEEFREHAASSGKPGTVSLLVGPEGGFSRGEIENARLHEWETVTFPLPQMRAETAAVVIPAIILCEWAEPVAYIPGYRL